MVIYILNVYPMYDVFSSYTKVLLYYSMELSVLLLLPNLTLDFLLILNRSVYHPPFSQGSSPLPYTFQDTIVPRISQSCLLLSSYRPCIFLYPSVISFFSELPSISDLIRSRVSGTILESIRDQFKSNET